MLKHNEIIKKLTVKQKIALLTDLKHFSDPDLNELGVPRVSVQSVENLLAATGSGLTSTVLARSWDPAIIESLVHYVTVTDPQGSNLIVTPSPKMQYGKSGSALSEDPVLSSGLAQAYLNGVHKGGAVGCLDAFYLTAEEVAHLDNQMDPRVLEETLAEPFRGALKRAKGEAVLAKMSGPSRSYGALNQSMIRDAEQRILQQPVNILCNATPDETVSALLMGCILLKGSATAVESAHEQYLHLKDLIASGQASAESLEEAFETGSAVSDEMLDEALDRVLALAMLCVEKKEKATLSTANREMLLKQAYVSTSVLFKNENQLLPLKNRKTVAVIGGLALERLEGDCCFGEAFARKLSNTCVGIEQGYDFVYDRIDAYLPRALEVAKKADVVFVLLGQKGSTGATNGSLLPANQIALLDALSPYRQKIVGILCSEQAVNMEFDQYVSGLLLATVAGRESAEALADLVSGVVAPCGKLPVTWYDDPDEEYARLRFYKTVGRNKVGPFMGYRRYDSSRQSVRYPFGFGLSYSSVSYSHLRVYSDGLSFTVENTGKTPVVEKGQIYVGMPGSKMLRPAKELKLFFRVDLQPREKKTLSFSKLQLEVPVGERLDRVIEDGEYRIYVGSSVQEIQQIGSFRMNGIVLQNSLERPSDYLQSESNILSDEYILEAGFAQMKTYNKWKLAGILTLVLAGLCLVLSILNGGGVLALLTLVALGVGISFLVISSRKRQAYLEELRAAQEESAKKLFAGAETVDVASVESLFAEEFDHYAQEQEDEMVLNTAEDVFRRVDRDLTLSFVRDQLVGFTSDRGIALGGESASLILSALASSRLILTDSVQSDLEDPLWGTLSAYFGAPLFSEILTEQHLAGGKLLAVKDEKGVRATALASAVFYALEHRETVCLAVLKAAKAADLGKLLAPFTRYFNNPTRELSVYVQENNMTYRIPDNLWFVVELAPGEKISDVPSYMAETATLLRAPVTACNAKQEPGSYRSVGFYDLEYVADMSRNAPGIDEDLWKKVDGIEAYVNGRTPYQIGNKLWLQMEKYIAVYTACGYEKNDALDRALAFNLLPVLTSVLNGKLSSDDKTLLETVEAAFGEDAVAVCRKTLTAASENA